MANTTVPEPTLQSAVEHSLMPSETTADADRLKGQVRCVIVTPEKAVYDGIAHMVVLPMFDGELGVLPGRAALIGRLGAGELRLKASSGATTRFFVEEGFAQVRSNVVTVLTAGAKKAETVTAEMATTAAASAEALPSGTAVERANKTRARDRASGLRKVAAKNAGAAAH